MNRARGSANRLENFLASFEAKIVGQAPANPARTIKELEDRLARFHHQTRLAWLCRPRLHTAIFAQVWEDDEIEKLGGTIVGDEARRRIAERAQKVAEIVRKVGWSDKRFAMFKQLVVSYRREPSIESYLRVRRQFPEIEIQIGRFGGIDPLFILEKEFQKHGIDPQLVAAILDADEPSIDDLCLQLIEKIVEREKISKDEAGHIQKRRAAISDAMVNYLIVTILESIDWNEQEVRIPASLVVLIRHQLTGINPDLHTVYLARSSPQIFKERAMATRPTPIPIRHPTCALFWGRYQYYN
jgi:hypothetical protein